MAHHRPVSKSRWMASQKRQAAHWHGQKALEDRQAHALEHYAPTLKQYADTLPENAAILEIGCGPSCTSRLIEKGKKTYVDPLLDDFKRAYPGGLPKGEHLAIMAERIPKSDHCYDFIVCLNTLSYVHNPELVLNEMERLLKPDGIIVLSIQTASAMTARLHYLMERCFPGIRHGNRPYYYSLPGIRKTLMRHFDIVETRTMDAQGQAFFRSSEKEWLFVCKHREHV